jgi:hypothetical protein
MFRREGLVSLMLLIVLLTSGQVAIAGCPSGTYKGLFGKCWPEVGGSVGQATEHVKNEIKAQSLGPILEAWINQSERTSSAGAQPIPPNIRQALTGYIDEASMDRARFKIGDSGVLNLAGLTVKYGDFFGGDVAAVTLNDVIVFGNANDAYNNPALWAHELTHVGQFRDHGVRGFAIAYMRRPWDMEGPAYQKGDNFWAWYQGNHSETLAQVEPQSDEAESEDDAAEDLSPGKYYWVGISWNHMGAVAVRTGSTPDEAQRLALQGCGSFAPGCFGGPVVPGDRRMCYAIVQDGRDLYSAIKTNTDAAASLAMQSCQTSGDPGPGCQVIHVSCNDTL